jgi:hypothetical protein
LFGLINRLSLGCGHDLPANGQVNESLRIGSSRVSALKGARCRSIDWIQARVPKNVELCKPHALGAHGCGVTREAANPLISHPKYATDLAVKEPKKAPAAEALCEIWEPA